MANFFQDNEDLLYYVEHGIDWRPLVETVERGFRDKDGFKTPEEAVGSYKDILDQVGTFVADEVAPFAAQVDKQGLTLEHGEVVLPPRLKKIVEQMTQLGIFGMTMPRELGGLQVPTIHYYLVSEIIARGDVSVLTQYGFYTAIAEALLLYSLKEGSTSFDPATGAITKTRWPDEITEVISGEACGSMDITESNAGSDMGAVRSKAEQDEQGNWFVTGEKIFITSGHGKFHFVVARTEDETAAPGLKGLSLFMVPAYETLPDGSRKRFVNVERLEEKLGHHASPTCVLTFDRSPAQLVGKRGDGFNLMLHLMNGARIGVGFEAIGLCEAAHRAARDYAAERKSMGKTIDRHEIIADYLDEAETDIKAMRAVAVHAAYHEEMALRLEVDLKNMADRSSPEGLELERRMRRHRRKSRKATPLVKFWAAEKAVEISRRAMQIHGGSGYTTEYPAERMLRDSLAMPIYEGTTQIQALMAMKDAIGAIMRNPQAFVRKVAQARWRALSGRDTLERRVSRLVSQTLSAQQHLLSKTATDKLKAMAHEPITSWPQAFFKSWDPKRDFAFALLHAERLTQMLCDSTAAEVLLEQAQKHPERRAVLEQHLERAEVRSRYLLDVITSTGERLVHKLQALDLEDESKKTA
jgi:alkylation response protein AidB-like acyl-CoA dehydrogenase